MFNRKLFHLKLISHYHNRSYITSTRWDEIRSPSTSPEIFRLIELWEYNTMHIKLCTRRTFDLSTMLKITNWYQNDKNRQIKANKKLIYNELYVFFGRSKVQTFITIKFNDLYICFILFYGHFFISVCNSNIFKHTKDI